MDRIIKPFILLFTALVTILSYETLQEIIYFYIPMPPFSLEKNYFFIDTICCAVMVVVYGFLYHRIYQHTAKKPILPSLQSILPCSIITLGAGGISLLWFIISDYLSASIPLLAQSMESFNETWSTLYQEPYYWSFLSVAFLGPLVEELIFRGLVFNLLEKVRPGWFPVIGSAIAFGIWHGEPVQMVYTAIIGIFLAIIYQRTHSLILCSYIHILNNSLSTLPPAWDTDQVHTILGIISYALILPALYLTYRIVLESKHPSLTTNTLHLKGSDQD
ncbi:CPBP family intramembrane glutamic endopeptidase [Vaginisenegalia massiliensis]|uniref:CPBP family intramembrane glutamic endopeptidase n=1 Tax=Vaginisenegalia massiliensis TaxID=2058294 RepID=UPI000F53237A|nr:CPBP family intramembrane glutamic endopeptidase [Vaginisenegalia massiliensis]